MEGVVGFIAESTADVVLKDNVVLSTQVQNKKEPRVPAGSLADMEATRQKWEIAAYRTSNQQLYAVLASCLAYASNEVSFTQAKARKVELEKFLKERNISFKPDAPLIANVIKAVFGGADRRRLSTYSIVLRAAQSEGVMPENLSSWIEECGGVQEIKLARSASYVSAGEKVETAKSTLAALPVLAVAKDKLAQLADADFMGGECVLIAVQQADGSFHIKAISRSAGAVNSALAALYTAQKKSNA
jgi:hypothetical protein